MALHRSGVEVHARAMDDIARDILVGYDGSTDADLALQWAAQTALLDDRPVTVAIIEDFGASVPAITWPEGHWVELENQASEVLATAGVSNRKIRRARGPLTPTMIALAHEASLLVLGSRGHSRAGELFVGSVSQHLARHAPCPVVVVRPPQAPISGRIVVGLDGSSASEEALEFACRRAQATGEKVSAVRAAKVGSVQIDRRGNLSDDLGAYLARQDEQLAASIAEAVTAYPDVDIAPELIALSPAVALVETSRTASLVVVGSRGLNAFTGMLLGSVSHEVLQRAHCPVAVVR